MQLIIDLKQHPEAQLSDIQDALLIGCVFLYDNGYVEYQYAYYRWNTHNQYFVTWADPVGMV